MTMAIGMPCCFNGAALFQVRKVAEEVKEGKKSLHASMGPHFFKCGKRPAAACTAAKKALLQWGRTFSSAESAGACGCDLAEAGASMGPHFFKCGKWQPSSPAAKIRCGFNGAALFQVRKGP